VTQFFEGETLARVLDTAGYRSTSPNERDLHVLAGIEMPAMFHGVNQNLLESKYDLVFLSLGNARVSDSVQELDQPIRGGKITSGRQGDPLGRPGEYFDAVVPAGFCHGRAHHRGQLRNLERRREITECSLAHRGDYVSGSKFIGEDNQADMRASVPDFSKEFNILRDPSFPPGDDQIERLGARNLKNMLIVDDVLNTPALAGQDIRKQFIDLAAGCY